MSSGKLEKLVIKAYKDPEFKDFIDEYKVMVNPEKYSLTSKSEYVMDQASGTSGKGPVFNRMPPTELSLDFLFDRTGVITDFGSEGAGDDMNYAHKESGITEDLEKFKKVTYDYEGDQHKPNYLIVSWGSLVFNCFLAEMTVEYKLFGSNGKPIRAMVKAKFKDFVAEQKRVAKENKRSPDLTHYRTVQEGDTLPLMTFRIYGDSKYYLEVAKINKLTNFRKLKVGSQLVFPPIQKQG